MSLQTFDPVKLSFEENEFLLDHIGEPPVVARRAIAGKVNPNAVMPILERTYELQELEKHSGAGWVGLDAIKEKIAVYLREAQKWESDKRRGRVRFPSMASWDSKGRPHMQGPGSDSGQVRTYFDEFGNRIPFAIDLVPDGLDDYIAPWVQGTDQPTSGLTNNHEMKRIECFCGHTEKYNPESRGSYNSARARMSKHLRTATDEVDKHREIHTLEFGS